MPLLTAPLQTLPNPAEAHQAGTKYKINTRFLIFSLKKNLNCGMDIQFEVDTTKLQEIVFKAVADDIIVNKVPMIIDSHDRQLKEIMIGACTHAVKDLFQQQGFKDWIKEAIKIEVDKAKQSIEHSKNEYKLIIDKAIKEEVQKKVRGIVNEPGFDHYIMGCVQLEVKDKILTII